LFVIIIILSLISLSLSLSLHGMMMMRKGAIKNHASETGAQTDNV
jgi:hypothetical protein